jgi:hypothetical protein
VKDLHVIFSFHAHEPLWDLPRRLVRGAIDRRVSDAVLPESYIRRRFKEGRNVYRDMIAFAETLGAPLAVDMTNELLHQIRRYGPGTMRELVRAFRDGILTPVYTMAHHTHPTLLTSGELLDELRLNQELLHDVLEVPAPPRKGVFFTENSVEARHLPFVEQAGIDYVITPELSQTSHGPVRLGKRLVGLTRHFDISQEIWRPLTLREPDRVKYQGFLVGEQPVFHDEYRGGPLAEARPGAPGAADEYAEVLRKAIDETPSGGLLLYVQDLELMDFGETALQVLSEAWSRVAAEGGARLRFVTPSAYLDAIEPETAELPRADIWQVSWAPEIRPAMRSDGHYPPRRAGVFRGYDADRRIYRRWPFVFWESGRFPTTLLGWLLESFGFNGKVAAHARTLVDHDYPLDRLPPRVRLPLLLRLTKRACNYGWYPEEGMTKRTYLDGLLIGEALQLELELRNDAPPIGAGLEPWVLPGLARLPELIVDTRVDYLQFGLERWREERGADPGPALVELDHARAMRRTAREELLAAADAYAALEEKVTREDWQELLLRVTEFMKGIFLALDHIQRAWGKADPDFLIVPMVRFLHDLYPPKLPGVLEEMAERWGFSPTTERAAVSTTPERQTPTAHEVTTDAGASSLPPA